MTLQDPRPARLAQSVEQQACELRVASLSPGMSDSLQRFLSPISVSWGKLLATSKLACTVLVRNPGNALGNWPLQMTENFLKAA